MHAAVAGRQKVEAFAIGTRLTRMTRSWGPATPTWPCAAGERVLDWSGGTRLGDGLRQFNDEWGVRAWPGGHRGGPVRRMGSRRSGRPREQMARLSRVAHRIIWVNPLKVTPGYAPLARGMAAALPYIDAFVEGHSLAAIQELAAEISR